MHSECQQLHQPSVKSKVQRVCLEIKSKSFLFEIILCVCQQFQLLILLSNKLNFQNDESHLV